MTGVNKTLYIPLYGKASVSKKGIILHDAKAEEIWEKEGFRLKGKAKSKWLTYYMGMRSAVFDNWLKEKMQQDEHAIVLHIGCGMDSRVLRVGTNHHLWYDVDFPDVIEERKLYYDETEDYTMIASDARNVEWLQDVPSNANAIVIMEGISMYFQIEELQGLLQAVSNHFNKVALLMDCYTEFAAKASKYKNPINDVGVTEVVGLDDPHICEENTGFTYVKEHDMTPDSMIGELQGMERTIFKKVFAGKMSQKMYRLYEFESV
ncbi:MAG: class I SAM-dependent methyltransferase [Lachnospiraceae bacterium]|nr:class I SAM-dependent methyltransferase [Lachnospiraceae bacterium]